MTQQRLLRPSGKRAIAVARDGNNARIAPVRYTEAGVAYTAHIFTTTGTITFSRAVDIEFIVVAGGGGGGGNIGGGGGGGGALVGLLNAITGQYTISVGSGGNGQLFAESKGSNSAAFGFTAAGGGMGGTANGGITASQNGGSGGGAGGTTTGASFASGGTGTVGQGNAGGGHSSGFNGGGGGGATRVGAFASPSSTGVGGAGLSSALSGQSLVYGSGGGGCTFNTPTEGFGGDGGGLGGIFGSRVGGSAVNGRGGGGGGGGYNTFANGATDGRGGSGTVIVRYRSSGTVPFDPTSISGLALWLDAADTSKVIMQGAGVERWEDKSGNNRHFTQSNTALMPSYTQTMNGRPVVTFNDTGSQKVLERTGIANSDFAGGSGGTLYIVWRVTAENTYAVLRFGGDSDGIDVFQIIKSYFGHFRVASDRVVIDNARYVTPLPVNGSVIYGTRYATTGNTQVFRANGAVMPAGSVANNNYFSFRNLTNQTYRVGHSGFNGDIAEVLAWNAPLTDAQITSVESYLSKKWGIANKMLWDNPSLNFAAQCDADTLTYLNNVKTADGGVAVEADVAFAIDRFVRGCKADGSWVFIQASCILCGARTLAGALQPLKGPAPTSTGFNAGNYSRKFGLLGGAGRFLNSNRSTNLDDPDQCHLAVYVTHATVGDATYPVYIGGNVHHIGRLVSSGDLYFRSNNSPSYAQRSPGTATGFIAVGRYDPEEFWTRVNGTNSTHVLGIDATGTGNHYVFAQGPSGNSPIDGKLAFYSIGGPIIDQDLAKFDARVTTLYTEINALIP